MAHFPRSFFVGVYTVTALKEIHQIEITSRCNLRCRYCVHPTMARIKQDMDTTTFIKSVSVAGVLARRAGVDVQELNLGGIGESTMHPEFLWMLAYVLSKTAPRYVVTLATNGLLVTNDLAFEMRQIADAYSPGYLRVWVSLHRPEMAGPAVEALRSVGLLAGVSNDPSVAAVDWAGQVKWHVSTPMKSAQCPWIIGGKGFVASNGDILTCSFDGSDVGKVGTVWDDPCSLAMKPYSLCEKCHLVP